jgi:DNA-binding HxlR family transcriptional regulator
MLAQRVVDYLLLWFARRTGATIGTFPYNLDRDSEGQYQHMPMQLRSGERVEREFFAARPIKPDLGVLGRKWTLLILTDIGLRRVDRFSSLLRSNPQLNPRILSRRLRELEEIDMIKKLEKNRTPPLAVRWGLTEKGIDILPAIIRLIVFGARWHAENPFRGKPPRRLT